MIETRRLKNVVIFFQTNLSFVQLRKITSVFIFMYYCTFLSLASHYLQLARLIEQIQQVTIQ